MTRGVHGGPAEALRQALETLAKLAFWIAWTADADLYPEAPVSARCLRDAAGGLRKAADLLDAAAEQVEAQHETGFEIRHRAQDGRP